MKLLIIEDELNLLEDMLGYLAEEHNVCEGAADFGTASEKISLHTYDIIVLDIMLPDGNGLELMPMIKKDNPESCVIIVSARNSLDDKISGLDLGADDYMTKPFHLSELNARVKAMWRRKKSRYAGDCFLRNKNSAGKPGGLYSWQETAAHPERI